MATNATLVWRSAGLAVFVVLLLFLIGKKFDAISEALGKLPNKLTFIQPTDSTIKTKNCVEDNDVLEQKLHFIKMAKDRQPAVEKPGTLNNLETYLVPQITCSTAVRIGTVGDGGKWVCNPWRAPATDCVVYSFGVNNEVSFEKELFEITKKRCGIFSFDPGNPSESIFKPFNGTFRSWAIAGTTNATARRYSIVDVAAAFSHSKIDFLKVDIEGSEFDAFKSLFSSVQFKEKQLEICQIFIEMHSNVNAWVELQQSLQQNGFLMFYKEANYYCPQCHEYSFIHRQCTQRYGIYTEPFNKNFV